MWFFKDRRGRCRAGQPAPRMAPAARHRHCCARKLGRCVEWVTRSCRRRSRGRRKIGYTRMDRCVTFVQRGKPVSRGLAQDMRDAAGGDGISHVNFFGGETGSAGDAERSPLQRKPDEPRSRRQGGRHRVAAHGTGDDDRDRATATRRRFSSRCRMIGDVTVERCARQACVRCRRPDRARASGRMRGRCACPAREPDAIACHSVPSACTAGRRFGQGIHRSRHGCAAIFRG